jgi:hypothetical protein
MLRSVEGLVLTPQAAAAEIEQQLQRALRDNDGEACRRAFQRLTPSARNYLAYGALLTLFDDRRAEPDRGPAA